MNQVHPLRRRRVRAAAAAMAIVSWVALLIASASAQPIQRSFAMPDGRQVRFDLKTGGAIHVSGWDRQEVDVQAVRRGRNAHEIQVDFSESASGLTVRTDYEVRRRGHNGSVDLEVRVPRQTDVELQTMGGDVTIADVRGRFSGQTMGGNIVLTGLQGTAELKTMGGSISVRDGELGGSVHTMGGTVTVENVIGNLKGSSMGGRVAYRNTGAGASAASDIEEVRISTMGGAVTLAEAPGGADLHTMGGEIHVGSASSHVRAKTMGGNIRIDAVDGWVTATTMGGDIRVRMTGDPAQGDRHVELTSMGGDVELTVPRGLSMDVDIELAYTRRHAGRSRIISDFPLEQEETTAWDDEYGTPRRTIYATGQIAGGQHLIRIRTINGNVMLRAAD
jgi:DUF4097 and DUF4098 domain-containing protein YvlB